MKRKLKNIETVEPNGRPTSVKVGYRDIQIKYIKPDFILDDMTESYGEYRPREELYSFKILYADKKGATPLGMKFCMQ